MNSVRFWKKAVMFFAIVGGVAATGICFLLILHGRAMERAWKYNGYLTIKRAYKVYKQTGVITNPVPGSPGEVFYLPTSVSVGGKERKCVLWMWWGAKNSRRALLAVEEEGRVLWFGQLDQPVELPWEE